MGVQRRDPVKLLGAVGRARLEELAARRRASSSGSRAARADLDGVPHRATAGTSSAIAGRRRARARSATSRPEFGITAVLPQYSGGLGILAGDHLKAASDLGVPIIGVGLLYRHGYFKQSLSREGWQQETYPVLDPDGLPISLLREADGDRATISIALPDGPDLIARIWVASVGRVPLLMLDTDVEGNPDHYLDVTDRLYGGNSEHRLRQELLLGVGGVRALRAYSRITGAPGARGLPHQRGPRRLPRPRADPRAHGRRGRPEARLRHRARGRPRLDRLHHPHPGARPASTASRGPSSSSTSATPAPPRASRSSGSSPSAPRTTTAATPRSSTWP